MGPPIAVVGFTRAHIPAAQRLARAAYRQEREAVPALPPELPEFSLDAFAENGLGVAATGPEGELLGFLCGCDPFERAFGATGARGVFSPMHANAAVWEGRADIYARLLPAAQERWARAGASSHAVCLYAHDRESQRLLFSYGFGLRCMDAIRLTEGAEEAAPGPAGLRLRELEDGEWELLYPLHLALDEHMAQSPTFIRRPSPSREEFLADLRESGDRCFAALSGGRAAAFFRVSRGGGETVVSDMPGTYHILHTYCLQKYRGSGLMQALLQFILHRLRAEGALRLSVDFESINPIASRFWQKHFAAYTHSVTRRIDEDVLKELAVNGNSHISK